MVHSQYGDRSSSLFPGNQELEMNPGDAAARGIADGDEVRIFNDRGAVRVRAKVSDDIMLGVVSLPEGIWLELDGAGEDRAGAANLLTATRGTGSDQACVMHGIAVEVAKA
jgi:anaerobic selenocysteine-containing dehydrogenase